MAICQRQDVSHTIDTALGVTYDVSDIDKTFLSVMTDERNSIVYLYFLASCSILSIYRPKSLCAIWPRTSNKSSRRHFLISLPNSESPRLSFLFVLVICFLSSRALVLLQADMATVRYIDVHQLTVALSLILSAQKDVQRMLAAWEALDVQPLLDQCALASNCDPSLLEPMLKGFHLWLVQVEAAPSRGGKAIESLGKFVDQVLRDAQGSHPGRLPVPNRA